MVKFFSICLVVLLLCSCHSRRKEIARIVEEWKNKEVIFYRMKGADHGGPMFFCEEMLDEVIKFIKKSVAHD